MFCRTLLFKKMSRSDPAAWGNWANFGWNECCCILIHSLDFMSAVVFRFFYAGWPQHFVEVFPIVHRALWRLHTFVTGTEFLFLFFYGHHFEFFDLKRTSAGSNRACISPECQCWHVSVADASIIKTRCLHHNKAGQNLLSLLYLLVQRWDKKLIHSLNSRWTEHVCL